MNTSYFTFVCFNVYIDQTIAAIFCIWPVVLNIIILTLQGSACVFTEYYHNKQLILAVADAGSLSSG